MPRTHYFCYPVLIWYMICPSCTLSSKRRTLKDLRFGESPDTWIVDVRVKPSKFPNNWKDLKIVKIEKQKSRPLNMSNILMWMALSIHLAKQSWELKVHVLKISKSWQRRYQCGESICVKLIKRNIQTITFKICFLFLFWTKILSKALIYAHPIFFGCKDCFLLCKKSSPPPLWQEWTRREKSACSCHSWSCPPERETSDGIMFETLTKAQRTQGRSFNKLWNLGQTSA